MRTILSDPAKSGVKMVHGLMHKITKTKKEHTTITKNKESISFSVQSIIAKPM